ncbi:helix-turn-helix transcriptional regulator [Halorubrum sp. Eb13]|uniref:ArsR/SmtB family transcription factor n=1 Tax=Halorubrum sp. Eb13 TaxID=1383843 RepID=UPI000B998BED|nr:metalloregulator ArsR/SmtB family transcription factor [Halorubrum sp. Eb13]OYR49287.1 transcriptional regulator [Halorubrum sp. Eb13]
MVNGVTADETGDETDGCCASLDGADPAATATDLRALTAMGNDTRYELLRLIASADGGVCVCDLEAGVGVGQSAVSQALSRLRDAGLVTRRKEGSWRYYGLTETAAALLETLDDVRGNDE